MEYFQEGRRTCPACQAEHVLFSWWSDRGSMPHAPVRDEVVRRCERCGEVVERDEGGDHEHSMLLAVDDPEVERIRAAEAAKPRPPPAAALPVSARYTPGIPADAIQLAVMVLGVLALLVTFFVFQRRGSRAAYQALLAALGLVPFVFWKLARWTDRSR